MTVEIIGPIRYHAVVVDGWRVPYLTAGPRTGGIVELLLDDRLSLDVPVADLDRMVEFIAHCIAVASGYTCHPGGEGPSEPLPRTGYKKMTRLGRATPE